VSEESDKQLEPTQARIAKARREGDVPRSPELVAAAAFGCATLAAWAVAPGIGQLARDAIFTAARGRSPDLDVASLLVLAAAPAAAGAVAAGCIGVAQAGGITLSAISLRLERLNPSQGVRRMLSRETAMHALRACAAFFVAVSILGLPMERTIVLASAGGGVAAIASAARAGVMQSLLAACAIGALFALAEYAVVRGAWLRRLRMTFEELKREIKEHEGDPLLRGRRRERQRGLLQGSLREIERASFVVANPTHIAIALEYAPPRVPVPRVLIRAAESAALRVRGLAKSVPVPVIENAALARALFRDGRVGSPIPVDYYVAVAEIVVALLRSGALAS
jgi:flagellar biosynthesis protein FlhB